MRIRRLALALLLSTSSLCGPMAATAQAGPIAAFIGGFLNAVGFGTFLASATWVGAWSAGFGAAAWLTGGSLLARVVLSVGLSALSQALMPRPEMPSPSDIMTNYAQDVSYVEWAYGQVRKGGPLALSAYSRAGWEDEEVSSGPGGLSFLSSADDQARRHYGVILACHPIDSVVTHYLDKWQVETDDDGTVTTDPINGRGNIRVHTGQPGQVPDPIWRAIFPEVLAADDFKGLAYGALYANRPSDEDFAEVYPTGREWVWSPAIRGLDTIYDPRSDSTGWTNNAALVIADIAVRIFGKSVDWDEVAAEADRSDEVVINRDGGSQARWTINCVIPANKTWEEVRAYLQMACDGFFYERRDGKLGFRVGGYDAPTLTLTADDFLSLSVRHRATSPDEVGSYAMRYVEPARDWNQEVTGAVVINAAGPRAEQECYAIDSHNQAWRVIWRWAKTAQPEWQISGTLKYIGREVMEQRFVRIQHAELGLDTVVEVATLSRLQGTHTWQLEAVSVEEADFSPSALLLEPPRTLRGTIAEDGTVPVPESLSGVAVEGTGGAAMIEWSWPSQDEDLRQQLRMRSPDVGISEWQVIDVPSGQASLVTTGLADGAQYEAQIRNRTSAGRLGDWAQESPIVVEAVANSDPPPAIEDFAAAVAGSGVDLSWTAPNSGLYAATRIWRAAGASAVFSSAIVIQTEYGAADAADSYTDPAPGVGDHRYWAEAINASGIAGPRSGPLTITII